MSLRLKELLELSHKILLEAKAPHALIGAFAMAAHGVHRSTNDIDFLVHGESRDRTLNAFMKHGFQIFHQSAEVLQLSGPGQIDILFANRPISQQMLMRTGAKSISNVPYLDAADLIGLKIQAYHNDQRRELRDLADIQSLIDASPDLDWSRVDQYADAFQAREQIRSLKAKGRP